jgi:hypothetical protein
MMRSTLSASGYRAKEMQEYGLCPRAEGSGHTGYGGSGQGRLAVRPVMIRG